MRKIHIEDKIYEYKVGKSGVQIISLTDRKYIRFTQFFNCTPSDLEKSHWKHNGCAKWSDITPGILKEYIIEKGI